MSAASEGATNSGGAESRTLSTSIYTILRLLDRWERGDGATRTPRRPTAARHCAGGHAGTNVRSPATGTRRIPRPRNKPRLTDVPTGQTGQRVRGRHRLGTQEDTPGGPATYLDDRPTGAADHALFQGPDRAGGPQLKEDGSTVRRPPFRGGRLQARGLQRFEYGGKGCTWLKSGFPGTATGAVASQPAICPDTSSTRSLEDARARR